MCITNMTIWVIAFGFMGFQTIWNNLMLTSGSHNIRILTLNNMLWHTNYRRFPVSMT